MAFNIRKIYKTFIKRQWAYADKHFSDWDKYGYMHGWGYDAKHSKAFRKILFQTIKDEWNNKI